MNRLVLAVALVAACCGPGCTKYRVSMAEDALIDGNYERSLKLWTALAKDGHAEAQYRVGVMHSLGQGTRKDEDEAVRWYRKAAQQGIADARNKVAFIYFTGRGNPEEDPDAERWLRETADQGTADSKYRLAALYLTGTIVEENEAEAVTWFRKAADAWGKSPRTIGVRLHDDGHLERMAQLGMPEAEYRTGQLYFAGNGVPMSKAEAAKWFFLAASKDFGPAQFTLGWIYGQGDGVPKDFVESARWFHKAAQQGEIDAQYQLGMAFERGLGVPLDLIQAHMWLNIAAAQGHAKAREKRDQMAKRLQPEQLTEAERLAVEWTRARSAKEESS